MYKYDFIREEVISGSLEDFRALMHEIQELQPEFSNDRLFLQGERTPSDYAKNRARWEITLRGTLHQRGFILARQLHDRTTKLQFVCYSKFKPIGPIFHVEFANYILEQTSFQSTMSHKKDDIEKLILNHNRRLQKLKEQKALYGHSIDPQILIEIEDIEGKLEELQIELENLRQDAPTIVTEIASKVSTTKPSENLVTPHIIEIQDSVHLTGLDCQPHSINRGQTVSLTFIVNNTTEKIFKVWLGASILDRLGKEYFNATQDEEIILKISSGTYTRYLTIPSDASVGDYRVIGGIWYGKCADPENSERISVMDRGNILTVQG